MNSVPDESLPLGDPPLAEHPAPSGVTEIGQRLMPFPFTPPDVRLDDKEALSHVFGRNFPWRFGAICSKLIESQINRNG